MSLTRPKQSRFPASCLVCLGSIHKEDAYIRTGTIAQKAIVCGRCLNEKGVKTVHEVLHEQINPRNGDKNE